MPPDTTLTPVCEQCRSIDLEAMNKRNTMLFSCDSCAYSLGFEPGHERQTHTDHIHGLAFDAVHGCARHEALSNYLSLPGVPSANRIILQLSPFYGEQSLAATKSTSQKRITQIAIPCIGPSILELAIYNVSRHLDQGVLSLQSINIKVGLDA